MIGRSHPGHLQCLSRALSARRVAGWIARVARPTSIGTDSANITRETVQSQQSLSRVFCDIGIDSSSDRPSRRQTLQRLERRGNV